MKLINISKTYKNKLNKVLALDNISLDIDHKGLYVIYGPSGSGKSTLLNIIAGIDKDYDGIYENDLKIAYLRQEFSLLEDLKVIDELLLIKDDETYINNLLAKFSLSDLKNKKIKKLSNGQKKRIELISALLLEPDVLLLDEPTSALDHDSAILVMETLKTLSLDKIVILVTHDTALTESYADVIYYLEDGKITKKIHNHEVIASDKMSNNSKSKIKRSFKDHLTLINKLFLSRKAYYGIYLVLLLLTITSFLVLFSLFTSTKEEDDLIDIYNNGENIIVSRGKNKATDERQVSYNGFGVVYGRRSVNSLDSYVGYNMIDYNDIKELVAQNEDIIATEAFYAKDYADYSLTWEYDTANKDGIINDTDSAYYLPIDQDHFNLDMYKVPPNSYWEKQNSENDGLYAPLPYVTISDEMFLINLDDYLATIMEDRLVGTALFGDDLYTDIRDRYVHMFVLNSNNEDDFPLVYGQVPQNENEVMIDANVAEILLELYGLEDMSELVGMKVYPSVYSKYSEYKLKSLGVYANYDNDDTASMSISFWYQYDSDDDLNFTYIDDTDIEFLNYMKEHISDGLDDYNDYLPFEVFPYEISAITSIKNEELNMIFKTESEDQIFDFYVKDADKLKFEYVNFILRPGSDYEANLEMISDYFDFEGTEFDIQSRLIKEEDYAFKDLTSFLPYIIVIISVMVLALIVYRLFDIKVIKKEKHFIKANNYHFYLGILLKGIVMTIISLVLAIIFIYPLGQVLNDLGHSLGYANIISYDLLEIALVSLMLGMIYTLVELVIGKSV